MKRPGEALGSVPPTTISRSDEVDRELEEALSKIVHDSKYNFKSSDEGDKTWSPERRGLPRHEW